MPIIWTRPSPRPIITIPPDIASGRIIYVGLNNEHRVGAFPERKRSRKTGPARAIEARRSFVWRGASQSFRGLRLRWRPKLATLFLSRSSVLNPLSLSLWPDVSSRSPVSLLGVALRRICTLLAVIPPPFRAARPFHPVLQRPSSNLESPFNPPRRLQSAVRSGGCYQSLADTCTACRHWNLRISKTPELNFN